MGGKQNCPVDGKCQTESVIYEATVTEVISRKKETYTGLTTRRFKDRLYEHNTNMNTRKYRLKDRATPYNPESKRCRICLKEKWYILYKADGATINRRSKIFNSCMHKSNLLSNLKL